MIFFFTMETDPIHLILNMVGIKNLTLHFDGPAERVHTEYDWQGQHFVKDFDFSEIERMVDSKK